MRYTRHVSYVSHVPYVRHVPCASYVPDVSDVADVPEVPEHLIQGCKETGRIFFDRPGDLLWVRCSDGNFLGIAEIQPAGKKVMSATAFANGRQLSKSRGYFL